MEAANSNTFSESLKENYKRLVIANSLLGFVIVGMIIGQITQTTHSSETQNPWDSFSGDGPYKNDYPLEYKIEMRNA